MTSTADAGGKNVVPEWESRAAAKVQCKRKVFIINPVSSFVESIPSGIHYHIVLLKVYPLHMRCMVQKHVLKSSVLSFKKPLKCCCTSHMSDLFVLVHIFRHFVHAYARDLHVHAQNSAHTLPLFLFYVPFCYKSVLYLTQSVKDLKACFCKKLLVYIINQ